MQDNRSCWVFKCGSLIFSKIIRKLADWSSDPDGMRVEDHIYLDENNNELYRDEMPGEDVYFRTSYDDSNDSDDCISSGCFEKLTVCETYLSFNGERSEGRYRVDGELSIKVMFEDNSEFEVESWTAVSG